jgi:transcriptional regulator with XRE-family HTH domain
MSKLGDLLHMERRHRKMNLREVSNLVGLSPIYISELETGKKIPLNGDSLVKLAGFYGLDPAELTKLAFQDKAEQRIQEGEESGDYAIARKKHKDALLNEILEGKNVSDR